MIVQRTREGKAVARTRDGYREGRPEKEVDRSALMDHITAVSERRESVGDACRALGIGRTTYYKLRKQAV